MRVKSNYQLGELIRLEEYNSFVDLVAKFTVSSLQVSAHAMDPVLWIPVLRFIQSGL